MFEDGLGHEIAQFRGPSKIPLGELSFEIIDLRGKNRDTKDYGDLPLLGVVEPAEESRLCSFAGRPTERG